MPEEFKGRTYKHFVYIYRFTLALLVGLGIYYKYTGKSTSGVLYGKYSGSKSVTNGGNELLIMAGALLFFQFLIFIFSKEEGKPKRERRKHINKKARI